MWATGRSSSVHSVRLHDGVTPRPCHHHRRAPCPSRAGEGDVGRRTLRPSAQGPRRRPAMGGRVHDRQPRRQHRRRREVGRTFEPRRRGSPGDAAAGRRRDHRRRVDRARQGLRPAEEGRPAHRCRDRHGRPRSGQRTVPERRRLPDHARGRAAAAGGRRRRTGRSPARRHGCGAHPAGPGDAETDVHPGGGWPPPERLAARRRLHRRARPDAVTHPRRRSRGQSGGGRRAQRSPASSSPTPPSTIVRSSSRVGCAGAPSDQPLVASLPRSSISRWKSAAASKFL